jgi:hypothetical protein
MWIPFGGNEYVMTMMMMMAMMMMAMAMMLIMIIMMIMALMLAYVALFRGNFASRLSHSCVPNCRFV